MDNKLLVGLSSIGAQQAAPTKCTNEAINQLLNYDYSAIYPACGILYRSRNMVLWAHSDAGYYSESKSQSRAVAHIFLSENDPNPRWSSPGLTLAQIIILLMSSASEVELGALFITAQDMVAMRNTLEEMKWPQPKLPIQPDNSSAAGVVNNNIPPRKLKTMNRRLH